MTTILFLHDESGSRNPRPENVPGTKMTQRPSEGTAGCNCDRWGHPLPEGLVKSQVVRLDTRNTTHSEHRNQMNRHPCIAFTRPVS